MGASPSTGGQRWTRRAAASVTEDRVVGTIARKPPLRAGRRGRRVRSSGRLRRSRPPSRRRAPAAPAPSRGNGVVCTRTRILALPGATGSRERVSSWGTPRPGDDQIAATVGRRARERANQGAAQRRFSGGSAYYPASAGTAEAAGGAGPAGARAPAADRVGRPAGANPAPTAGRPVAPRRVTAARGRTRANGAEPVLPEDPPAAHRPPEGDRPPGRGRRILRRPARPATARRVYFARARRRRARQAAAFPGHRQRRAGVRPAPGRGRPRPHSGGGGVRVPGRAPPNVASIVRRISARGTPRPARRLVSRAMAMQVPQPAPWGA